MGGADHRPRRTSLQGVAIATGRDWLRYQRRTTVGGRPRDASLPDPAEMFALLAYTEIQLDEWMNELHSSTQRPTSWTSVKK